MSTSTSKAEQKEISDSMQDFGINAAKSTMQYTLSKLYASLMSFILILFLARYLGVNDFGLYTVLFSFYVILGIAGSFGIGTAFRNKLGDKKIFNEILVTGYSLAIIFGVAVSIIGILLSSYMASLYPAALALHPNLASLFELTSLIVLIFVLNNITLSALVAINKTKHASIVNIVFSSVQIASIVILVLLGYNVFGAMLGMLIGILAGFCIGIVSLFSQTKLKWVLPNMQAVKNLMLYSFPVMVSNIAVLGVSSFSVIYLGTYVTPFILGNYSASFRIARIVETLILSTTFVIVPVLSNIFRSNDIKHKLNSIFNSALYYMLLFLIPFLVYAISSATPISRLLFSHQYLLAHSYLQIMLLGFGLFSVTNFSTALLVSHGDTKSFMLYQLALVFIEFMLLFLITPLFKTMGVLVLLFFIMPIVSNVVFLKVLSDRFSVKIERRIILMIVPSIILFGVLYLLSFAMHNSYYVLVANLALTIVLYPILLVKFKLLTQKNIDFMRQLQSKLPMVGIFLGPIMRYAELCMGKPGQQSMQK